MRRAVLQRTLIGHSCRFLVEFHQVINDEIDCFVEMGYLPWPPLNNVLAHVPDTVVPTRLHQLVEAVRPLESQSIVHRDFEPENILVAHDFAEFRLIDLGVTRDADVRNDGDDGTDHGERSLFIATAQYISPEYLFCLQSPAPWMWSAQTFDQVGAVLHDLLVKQPLVHEAARSDNEHVVSMVALRQ